MAKKSTGNNVTIKRLYRSNTDRIIGGVCGGLGNYLEVDPVILRIIWAVLALTGIAILAYIIAWIIIPKNPDSSK